MNKKIIPIFFASDDNYLPYLAVALTSLIENANKTDYEYNIYVLNNGIKKENMEAILAYKQKGFNIEFIGVQAKLEKVGSALATRDYYSNTTYFRFFIQTMFPEYNKALYLDADIVVLGDISKLYNIDIKDNVVGAVLEQIVASTREYRDYSRIVLNLDYRDYFNAGILVMNLEQFRKQDIETKFIDMISTYKFDTIAQDQDYLNFLLKGKVHKIDLSWNKESLRDGYKGELNLIHYALFKKPWTYYGMKYDKYFWQYAKKTQFYDFLVNKRKSYTMEQRANDLKGSINLRKRADKISASDYTFYNVLEKHKYERICAVHKSTYTEDEKYSYINFSDNLQGI